MSPNYVRDHTLICGAQLQSGDKVAVLVFSSRDGGRNWKKSAASGLTFDSTKYATFRLLFSPDYARDRRTFVGTSGGLFVSTDLGNTYTLVDNLMDTGFYRLYRASSLPGSVETGLFAISTGRLPRRVNVDSGTRGVAVGVPGGTQDFLAPPSFWPEAPLLAVGPEPTSDQGTTYWRWWTCSPEGTCIDGRGRLPKDVRPKDARWVLSASRRPQLLVLTAGPDGTGALASDDAGFTFRPLAGLAKAIAPAARYSFTPPEVGVATDPKYPGLIVMRVRSNAKGNHWDLHAPPGEQVFLSRDAGQSWLRIAYGPGFQQGGVRGNLPFNASNYGLSQRSAPVDLTPDGRILIPGSYWNANGLVPGTESVYCSADLGRSWHRVCP